MKMSHFKALALVSIVSATVGVTSSLAAQEVTLAGTAAGKFVSNGGVFTSGQGCTVLLAGLQYCGSSFNDKTVAGFLGIGGNAVVGSNFNNFGSFALDKNIVQSYSGQQFDLMLTLTSPLGISGGQSQTFSSLITGSVNSNGNGGVFINFDNTPNSFSFTGSIDNPSVSGMGSLVVNDMSVNAGQVGAVAGYFQATETTTVTPEPSTDALMGTGVLAVGFVRRRKTRVS